MISIENIFAVSGVLMIVIGLLGSLESDKFKVPLLPNRVRLSVAAIGVILLSASVFIFFNSPSMERKVVEAVSLTQTAQPTATAPAQLATQTPLIVTQIVEVTPGTDDRLSIEEIPGAVYTFFYESPDPSRSTELTLLTGGATGVKYKHVYSFPAETDSSAVLTFRFDEPIDLSAFHSIEFTVVLNSDLKDCEFYVWDEIDNFQSTSCKAPFDENVEVNVSGNRQSITIPLEDIYPKVNFKVVKAIYFVVRPTLSQQKIDYEVSDIHFTR